MQGGSEATEELAPFEDLYEVEKPKEKLIQVIIFRLNREWYGIEITKVKEILRVIKVIYLPSSPEHIAGMVTRRGNILSVTDLKTLFGLPHEDPTDKARIIAIESGIFETGLLVDEVVESIEVPARQIEPPLLTLPAEGGRYVEGQYMTGNKVIALLSVEKIFERMT